MTRAALLALDGGSSKIDAVLGTKDGRVLGAARWQGSVYEGLERKGSLHGITSAVKAACADAGLDPDALPVADLGVFCVAGADLPSDDQRIDRLLRRRGFTREHVVRNDTFAVLRAGTDAGWGVGVVCGSGINCTGVAPDGRKVRFAALGAISGDWGGGFSLGEGALGVAIRARDGRGPRTSLERLIPDYFGMKKVEQVMEAIYRERMDEGELRLLAPVVFAAAGDGDVVARSLLDRLADEVVGMAGAAIRRLRITGEAVVVVLGGSIFRSEDPLLFGRIREGLEAVAPRVEVRVLRDPPVVGAVLLGLDRLGAPRSADPRLRSALTHERLTAETSATGKRASGTRKKE